MKRRQALALLASSPAWAQTTKKKAPPQPPPSAAALAAAAELNADIDLAREILSALHPGLLRYNSQLQIDAGTTSLKRGFAGAPDLAQRYLVLSRFLATLKCGQSHASFFNQKPEVARTLFDRRSRLPFSMRWIGEGMFITGEQERLPRGTQVGAINGVPVRTMLAALLPYARADGSNDAQRRARRNLRGATRLESFDVFHGLVYGEPRGGVFKLDVRTPDGRISALEVPALTADERHAQVIAPAPDAPQWHWRIDEPHAAAVLTMPQWALDTNRPWDWRAWLDDKLDALGNDAAIKGLVVDLRGNEGGLDCGNLVLERFLQADSVLPLRRLVRYQKTPEALNRHLDTQDESLRDWGGKTKPFDSRFYALSSNTDSTVKPKGTRIADKALVVITDAGTSASAFTFAQRVKLARVGRLVGEATGGNQRGINGSAFFFVRLPASGLEFDLPLVGSFALQPAKDAGIEPDVKVEVSAVDIATGIDAQMERALVLAKGA
jgi:Peptidase family S41